MLAGFLAYGIDRFTPHDLRRTGRTTPGRLKVSPFVGERVINHSKDVLQETYDLWDYFDEKRDALERLENYRLRLRDNAGVARMTTQVPPTRHLAASGDSASRTAPAHRGSR